MTCLSLVLSWYSYKEVPAGSLGDAPVLSRTFAQWRQFILEQNGTPRSVKRFENRARFLATHKQFLPAEFHSETIARLVGLVALEETGAIESSIRAADFEEWKKHEWPTSVKPILSRTCASIIEGCSERDWKRYRALTTGATYEENGNRGIAVRNEI